MARFSQKRSIPSVMAATSGVSALYRKFVSRTKAKSFPSGRTPAKTSRYFSSSSNNSYLIDFIDAKNRDLIV